MQFFRSLSISRVVSMVVWPISFSSSSLLDFTSARYLAIFIAMLNTFSAQLSFWKARMKALRKTGFILGISIGIRDVFQTSSLALLSSPAPFIKVLPLSTSILSSFLPSSATSAAVSVFPCSVSIPAGPFAAVSDSTVNLWSGFSAVLSDVLLSAFRCPLFCFESRALPSFFFSSRIARSSARNCVSISTCFALHMNGADE
mmetsp:Transcript_32673/g.63007  ORF Transcript_32673/g.63007 Transcript_32673/m.63007 type:complete len:201 (+) Transcript_32673:2043-2645(+)